MLEFSRTEIIQRTGHGFQLLADSKKWSLAWSGGHDEVRFFKKTHDRPPRKWHYSAIKIEEKTDQEIRESLISIIGIDQGLIAGLGKSVQIQDRKDSGKIADGSGRGGPTP